MKLGLHISLAHTEPPWTQSPHTLISLWDMIELLGYEFVKLLSDLEWEGFDSKEKIKQCKTCIANQDDKSKLAKLVDSLGYHCARLGMVGVNTSLNHFKSRIEATHSDLQDLPFSVVESEISGVRYAIHCELHGSRFAFIPNSRHKFFEQASQFGLVPNGLSRISRRTMIITTTVAAPAPQSACARPSPRPDCSARSCSLT